MSTIEFNEALVSMEGNLHSFAMSFTRNNDDAKDLTQETMLKAIIYRSYYTPQTNFKAWVFTIMRNIFINQYRRKAKNKTIFDHSKELIYLNTLSSNEESPITNLLEKEVNKQINALDSEYKRPFEMHYQGFKYKEISISLGIPIGTVKSRIFIARKKLMKLLPDYNYSIN